MKGTRRKTGYMDDWLVANGCEPGSTILMTESAFMTDAAWVALSHKVSIDLIVFIEFAIVECFINCFSKLVPGYRSLPVIADNPQW